MICERAEVGKDFATVKRKIEILLQDSYYVPVLRAEDRSLPPVVGEPFSPTHPPVSKSNNSYEYFLLPFFCRYLVTTH